MMKPFSMVHCWPFLPSICPIEDKLYEDPLSRIRGTPISNLREQKDKSKNITKDKRAAKIDQGEQKNKERLKREQERSEKEYHKQLAMNENEQRKLQGRHQKENGSIQVVNGTIDEIEKRMMVSFNQIA